MATYTKFQNFVEHLAEGSHNLASGTVVLAFSNSAPNAATGSVLADISEVSYTNLATSRALTTSSSSQTGGTYSLVLADWVGTASGGSVGPFQYVVLYNDTPAGDPLIAYYDYGSPVTLQDAETFTVDFGATLFTLV